MYLRRKNEVARSRLSKVRAQTSQTHRQANTHTHTQTRPNALLAAFAGGNNSIPFHRFISGNEAHIQKPDDTNSRHEEDRKCTERTIKTQKTQNTQ